MASGKGGAGKTTVALSLAVAAENGALLLDCDVEEPNAHLYLNPEWEQIQPVQTPVPVCSHEQCIGCGACAELCEFNAVAMVKNRPLVFTELCHSCGGCARVCPSGAMTEKPRKIGEVRTGTAGAVRFSDGIIAVGTPSAPPVIRAVKQASLKVVNSGLTVIDCPPGASCPMVAAVEGADAVLLVAEPTPFGLHDLKVSAEALLAMKIPFAVLINRSDMGDNGVEHWCVDQEIPIAGRIPEIRAVMEKGSSGGLLVDTAPEWLPFFRELPSRMEQLLQKVVA